MILICWKTCYKFCWRLAFISLHSETCLSYESYVCHICFICFSYVQEGNYSGFCEALAVGGCQDAAISVTLAQPQDGHGSFVAGCRPGCPWWLWGMLWQCPTLPSLSQSSLTYLQNINHYIHYLYIYWCKANRLCVWFYHFWPFTQPSFLAGARLPFNWR